MKAFLNNMWIRAMELNKRNILSLIEEDSQSSILDLGCDNGEWTKTIGQKARTLNLFGIEIVAEAAKKAKENGIDARTSDLSKDFPFDSNCMDIIHANQVIEHVPNLDHFMREIQRVLKPGGSVIISTENGSSWCNIFASIMGWQIFSLTNFSSMGSGIGNPFAIHRSCDGQTFSWTHKTIFNYLGLKEYFKVYGFHQVVIKGAGYFPLPAIFGKSDVRHSHFLTVRAIK